MVLNSPAPSGQLVDEPASRSIAVTRRTVALTFVLVAAAACGTTSQGQPTTATAGSSSSRPDDSTVTSTPSPATPDLAEIDPCSLITTTDLAQLGLVEAEPESDTIAGRPLCDWSVPNTSVVVYLHPTSGIAEINTNRATRVENRTIGAHDGRLVERPNGTCDIDIVVTDTSAVTVSAVTLGRPADACPLVERAATIVEPRVPRG